MKTRIKGICGLGFCARLFYRACTQDDTQLVRTLRNARVIIVGDQWIDIVLSAKNSNPMYKKKDIEEGPLEFL